MGDRLFGRYGGAEIAGLLDAAGVMERLAKRGFTDVEVTVRTRGLTFPQLFVHARKEGRRHLLLDGCLREANVSARRFAEMGWAIEGDLSLLVVHWVREQDPTARFTPHRPPLPLQSAPGLGILRHAFRALVEIARATGKDGVANVPKFYHDAYIFYRSRLFVFLDGEEQGRFESLVETLSRMPLREASLAVLGWCLQDERGRPVRWEPGYQVFPMTPALTAYLHSPVYAAAVDRGRRCRFFVDAAALARIVTAAPTFVNRS